MLLQGAIHGKLLACFEGYMNLSGDTIIAPGECLSSWFISAHICLQFTNNNDKTQEIIILVQRQEARLHCTQDGHPPDGLTASSYHLFDHSRTLKGHVELLNRPVHHHLINPLMLFNHILDLLKGISHNSTRLQWIPHQLKIGLDVMIQSRTHCLSYLQLALGCNN